MAEAARRDKVKAAASIALTVLSIALNGLFILIVGGAVLFFVVTAIGVVGSLALLVVGLLAYIAWKMPKRRS